MLEIQKTLFHTTFLLSKCSLKFERPFKTTSLHLWVLLQQTRNRVLYFNIINPTFCSHIYVSLKRKENSHLSLEPYSKCTPFMYSMTSSIVICFQLNWQKRLWIVDSLNSKCLAKNYCELKVSCYKGFKITGVKSDTYTLVENKKINSIAKEG